jgi:hypothetical protein
MFPSFLLDTKIFQSITGLQYQNGICECNVKEEDSNTSYDLQFYKHMMKSIDSTKAASFARFTRGVSFRLNGNVDMISSSFDDIEGDQERELTLVLLIQYYFTI